MILLTRTGLVLFLAFAVAVVFTNCPCRFVLIANNQSMWWQHHILYA